MPRRGTGRPRSRLAALVGGFLGPLLLVGSLATRLGLGLDAPWYLGAARRRRLRQLCHTARRRRLARGRRTAEQRSPRGRYAPYPSAAERPRLGPAATHRPAGPCWAPRNRKRPPPSGNSGPSRPRDAGTRPDSPAESVAVSRRHEDERVRRGCPHDHVRLAPGQRVEDGARRTVPNEPGPDELVPVRVRLRPRAEAAAFEPRDADRRCPGEPAAPAGRRARSRRAPRPGSRAARRRAGLPARRTRSAFPASSRRPRRPPRRRARPRPCRTRSCGPTETPPEVTRTSAVEPRARASRWAASSSATELSRSTSAPADPAARRAGSRSPRRSVPAPSGSPGRRSSLPVTSTAARGLRRNAHLGDARRRERGELCGPPDARRRRRLSRRRRRLRPPGGCSRPARRLPIARSCCHFRQHTRRG